MQRILGSGFLQKKQTNNCQLYAAKSRLDIDTGKYGIKLKAECDLFSKACEDWRSLQF